MLPIYKGIKFDFFSCYWKCLCEVVSLSQGASISEIKKAYRTLSKELHPDKGGDEKMFMAVAKAYAAWVKIAITSYW